MFEDPTSTVLLGGSGIVGWRTNPALGSSYAPASLLLAAGPTTGEVGVASAAFVVSADGALAGSVTITPSASGGTGTFSPTSQSITTGQTAQFTFTPNATGAYTISFSNTGGLTNPVPLPYEAVSSAPPIDIENNWLVDVSPLRAWLASQGTIPANCLLPTDKHGLANKVRAWLEKCGDTGQTIVNVDSAATTSTTIDHNGGTWLSLVADPTDAGRTVYKMRVNKTLANWTVASKKWRSQIGSYGNNMYEPWDGEQWCVAGIYLPAIWHQLAASGGSEWCVLMEWHDAGGGLTGNPPLAVEWRSGAGVPANSKMSVAVRRYSGSWPVDPVRGANTVVAQTEMQGMTDDWVYLIWRIRTGCGYVDYPDYVDASNWGAPVEQYGPVGTAGTAFAKLYAAFGESAVPQQILDYQGFWGSPFPTSLSATKKARSGYWIIGVYGMTTFNATTGDDREMWSRGFTQWRATDIPETVSAADMLAAFKALRD